MGISVLRVPAPRRTLRNWSASTGCTAAPGATTPVASRVRPIQTPGRDSGRVAADWLSRLTSGGARRQFRIA